MVPTPGERSTPTIIDVAALAGVSPSAVSRALNHPGRITPATTAKIQAAADELGFRFNPAARALLSGRTMTIGLVLADITNPVVFGVIRGAERAAAASGFSLIIAESQKSGSAEIDAAHTLLRSVDGIVLAMSWLEDQQIHSLAAEKPLVLVNRAVEGVNGVVPDVKPGIEELLDHLAGRGHRDLAYVSGPEQSWMNSRRREAIADGVRRRGLSLVEIAGGEPTIDAGRAATERVLASAVTAVLAYNDLMAIGLLKGAQAHGVDVPGSLAISGFDAIFGGELTTPELTTVATPLEAISARAVGLLVGAGAPNDAHDALRTRLIVRGTT